MRAAWSMAASVVNEPRLNRMAQTARSGRTPIALRTWEGVVLPLWHAEPADAAMPARSSAMSIESLSVSGNETFTMWGARGPDRA